MSYMVVQKRKGGWDYFSTLLFPHWEGGAKDRVPIGAKRFENEKEAKTVAKRLAGTVITVKP